MPHHTRRKRRVKAADIEHPGVLQNQRGPKGNMYCRNIDGQGYCCSSAAVPNGMLCEVHRTMVDYMQFQPAYMQDFVRTQFLEADSPYLRPVAGLGTSPLTVAASEQALKMIGGTSYQTQHKPSVVTLSAQARQSLQGLQPTTTTLLVDELNAHSNTFKNLVDHFGDEKWADLLFDSPDVPSNKFSKKVAAYVRGKTGIDYKDAMTFIGNGDNIRVLGAAGVDIVQLVAELISRDSIWNGNPYLRYLLEQKHAPGSEEYKSAKRGLIDELSRHASTEPGMYGDAYSELFARAEQEIRAKLKSMGAVFVLDAHPLPVSIPKLDDKETILDLILGMLPKTVGMPDSDPDDPAGAVKTFVSNMKAVHDKFKCAEKGATSVTDTCWDWVDKQTLPAVTASGGGPEPSISDYAAVAQSLLPEFVVVLS